FDIEKTIYSTLEAHHSIANPDLETVLDADHWAREYANELLIRK
ncbi:1-deoxy-D-xylulose-5-phosphate reductoisomerase, partial [Bacillus wiedmannii]